jgi:uncharacterized membrane protein
VSAGWEERLGRWVDAGLLEPLAADRIRRWESAQLGEGPRWPARLALGLGGLLLCAGVLLFVAAHWDALSPSTRFTLLLTTVAGFHLAGASAGERAPGLSTALHACGTVALGGGIFLAGQIFHLSEHWPGGLLLWAIGAWAGWALLRDWPQALLAALLTPAWLAGEWVVAVPSRAGVAVLDVGLLLTALAYLSAVPVPAGRPAAPRRALVWVGGIALLPVGLMVAAGGFASGYREAAGLPLRTLGWTLAVGGPLTLAWFLRRGRPALPFLALAGWTIAGPFVVQGRGAVPYLWSAILSLGLVAWGVLERRSERINLGVAGFALSVVVFYFSSVMDRLGRSASLVGLGLLFLGGGWALEQGRRRLIERTRGEA